MPQSNKSKEEVQRGVSKLSEEIAFLKERARERGLAFSSLNDDELAKKIKGETSKSPFIYSQSWTSGAGQGSAGLYSVHVQNPDPNAYFPFYATMFFGLGNFFDVGQAWIGRDKRWPEFSSARALLSANSTYKFDFNYTVPTGLPLGTYNGNSVIWVGDWHDVGTAFDRGSFDIEVM